MQSIKDLRFTNTYYLARHGHSEKNRAGIVTSDTDDYPLTSEGREKAKASAEAIHDYVVFDVLICSPVLRARETAAIYESIHAGATVHIDERLSEINFGSYEGKTVEEYHAYFEERIRLGGDAMSLHVPEGESLEDIQNRMVSFINDVNKKYSNKTIAVISHKSQLWMLTVARLGITDSRTIWNTWGGETLKCGEFMQLL